MTPLWVISLFVSLTEVVTGLALTRASGPVQVALTTFVIGFPLLVASAFFLILWFRPYVFYPPTEFSSAVDVSAYVRAMSNKVEVVRSDVEAEAAHLRARIGFDTDALVGRIETLEDVFGNFVTANDGTRSLLQDFDAERRAKLAARAAERSIFEENAGFRVEVAALENLEDPVGKTWQKTSELAKQLAAQGFSTATRGWDRNYYKGLWENSRSDEHIYVLHSTGRATIVARLEAAVSVLAPSVPVSACSLSEAADKTGLAQDAFVDADFDAAVVYYRGAA